MDCADSIKKKRRIHGNMEGWNIIERPMAEQAVIPSKGGRILLGKNARSI